MICTREFCDSLASKADVLNFMLKTLFFEG